MDKLLLTFTRRNNSMLNRALFNLGLCYSSKFGHIEINYGYIIFYVYLSIDCRRQIYSLMSRMRDDMYIRPNAAKRVRVDTKQIGPLHRIIAHSI